MEFIATFSSFSSSVSSLFQSLVGSGVYCDTEIASQVLVAYQVSIPSREWSLLRLFAIDREQVAKLVSIPSREWSLLRQFNI